MKNPRISKKEAGLIKGSLRRVFSRSDLRRAVIEAVAINHVDPTRPRVKKWSQCQSCKQPTPRYLMECDHIIPLIPLDKTLEDLDWNTLINRLWCDILNLQAICQSCHKLKCSLERKARNAYKKDRKPK